MQIKKITLIIFLLSSIAYSQRLDNLGKAKPVTISGGFSANSIFYDGTANRDAFTYFLNGSINVNLYGLYNIPVSFAYTNQQFAFNEPSFKINRLSIHPSYKWVATHIGDVSMSFSPYTLSGHQFTGFGIDLTPNSPFKVSAMYGRLIRKREFNLNEPQVEPSYKRMGYGIKTAYEKSNYKLGIIAFKAKDELNSLNIAVPDDLGIAPKENLVLSLEGGIKILKKGNIDIEYASSALTNDIRSEKISSNKVLATLFDNRISTSYHNAFKTNLTYIVGKGSLGVGYERVDPQYQTLGAYYFNNDLENITAKVSQTLFNNKLNININTGLQRDDLKKQKQSKLSRLVSAINLNLRASEKLTVSGSYSNFRAFTQIKNQFDYINEVRPYDNLDTLNFTQISQNANLNFNYNFSQQKKKRQAININLSYQNTAEKQDGFLVDINTNDSQFFNGNAAYSLTLSEKKLSITGAFNSTYNTISSIKTLTMGPTLAIAKYYFDKKMRTSFSSSYNTTSTDGLKQGDVLNFRLGGSYRYKENHNFNLNIIQLYRNSETLAGINDFTATFGYNYTFNNRKKKRKTTEIINEEKKEETKTVDTTEKLIKISHKGYRYEGTPSEITKQLATLYNTDDLTFLDKTVQDNISERFKVVQDSEKGEIKKYKESVYTFIDAFDNTSKSLNVYKKEVTIVLNELSLNIAQAHNEFQKQYIESKGEFNKLIESDPNYNDKKATFENAKKIFMHHSWILTQLQKPIAEIKKGLHIFRGSMLNEVTQMRANGKSESQIASQIKLALIAFYDEEASKKATENDIKIIDLD